MFPHRQSKKRAAALGATPGGLSSPFRAPIARTSLAHASPAGAPSPALRSRAESDEQQLPGSIAARRPDSEFAVETVLPFPLPVREATKQAIASGVTPSVLLDDGSDLALLVVPEAPGLEGAPRLLAWSVRVLAAGGAPQAGGSASHEIPVAGALEGSQGLHAAMVCVVPASQRGREPGVMFCTANGQVHYWPDVSSDLATGLHIPFDDASDSAVALAAAAPAGFVLATHHGHLYKVEASETAGRPRLSFSHVWKDDGASLMQLGRRVGNFFGLAAASDSPVLTTALVVGASGTRGSRQAWHLTSTSCALWAFQAQSQQMLSEVELIDEEGRPLPGSTLADAISATLGEEGRWRTELLDVSANDEPGTAVLLVAVVDRILTDHSKIHYLLGAVAAAPSGALSVRWSPCTYHPSATATSIQDLLRAEVLALPGGVHAVINTPSGHAIPCSLTSEATFEPIILGDTRGSGVFHGVAMYASSRQGGVILRLVSPGAGPLPAADSDDSTMAVEGLQELRLADDDQITVLAQAFTTYRTTNQLVAVPLSADDMDSAAYSLSLQIVDAAPANDPRWAEDARDRASGYTAAASLIVQRQLEEKMQVHQMFIAYLVASGCWGAASPSPASPDSPPAGLSGRTRSLILQHAEKLAATIALRSLHAEPRTTALIDEAIRKVVAERKEHLAIPGLEFHDVFYRQVSAMDDLFIALVATQAEALAQYLGSEHVHERASIIYAINQIFEMILQAAYAHRRANPAYYQPSGAEPTGLDAYELPWTCSTTLRHLLLQQHGATLAKTSGDVSANEEQLLFQQLFALSDVLLDGFAQEIAELRKRNVDTTDVERHFVKARAEVMTAFVESPTQAANAQTLAERFEDFHTLIVLCERADNKDKLDAYSVQFGKPFTDFLFKWYLEKGKRKKLLQQPAKQNTALAEFLESHSHLRWLHQIHTNRLGDAHTTLQTLASQEANIADRQRTLLSLAKLALMASGGAAPEKLTGVNSGLSLLDYQDELPPEVVRAWCQRQRLQAVRPLSAVELIELFIEDDTSRPRPDDGLSPEEQALEHFSTHFVFAAELLYFYAEESTTAEQKASLEHQILVKAILLNQPKWAAMENEPLESIRATVLCRFLTTAFSRGIPLSLVEGIDAVLGREELRPLCKGNPRVAHFVRLAVELSGQPEA